MTTERDPARCDADGHCITCSDEGTVMRVIAMGDDATAICEDPSGQRTEIPIDLVAPIAVGDRVLVHAGVALQRLVPAPGAAS